MTNVVIIGGGPGGIAAAMSARRLGADVTLIERNGVGGSAVLTDVVPSKALVSAGQAVGRFCEAASVGLRLRSDAGALAAPIDFHAVTTTVRDLALAQSRDTTAAVSAAGVRLVSGHGRLDGRGRVVAETETGEQTFDADMVLIATGGRPRVLDTAKPDGERILSWAQVYQLSELPEHLVIVGSGVTGAEFSSAFRSFGSEVTLVSARDEILPGQDPDAARVIHDVFEGQGIQVLDNAHAETVTRSADGIEVTLKDGRVIAGSHCLVAVGAVPNTEDLGLETCGVEVTPSGHIKIDGVSRTTSLGVYAAGDCADGMKLASAASLQGRIATRHALGHTVGPLRPRSVASGIYTTPEVATVGIGAADITSGAISARSVMVPLASNARTKMKDFDGGFIKLFCLPATHIIVGGVVVSMFATELIHSVSLAVKNRLTVEQMAETPAVYPSLSGSIAEAAELLRGHVGEEVVLY
ncbi:MAG: NAD(P)H-quinone dehydrogenase [Propionibacteriaceae bacterium]|jgi:dihydrolipoamide dehydrogenase|nr:NAD(P)H-quinone dehydrogenase [Propionibacteriaceae bacterium]